jgi:NADH:ubiquinone reductase (H+-translocating)
MATHPPRPRIVIIGAGFGGLAAARALAKANVDVTVIDRQNYHLFQPLLYQVATAGLSPADIAAPIRSILNGQANACVRFADVCGIDTVRGEVLASDGLHVPYDWLIVATGARHSYFGRDGWGAFAPGIKTIDDATRVRRQILLALERAETATQKAERDRLLTFIVIGGGPTGVEMAGAIAELTHHTVGMDFRNITPHCAKVILVQSGDRLLPGFPPKLSAIAKAALERMDVEVRLGCRVETVDGHGALLGSTLVPAATLVWAAGVKASAAAKWLGVTGDKAGRVPVAADLTIAGHANVFVIGDTAAVTKADGTMVPGVAPAAKQQGVYAARAVLARMAGRDVAPFRYRDAGNLATIGRKSAVADFGRFTMHGFPAWLLWCVAHVWFLVGFRNRLTVGASWLWNYITFDRGARLITGHHPDADAAPAE